MSGKVINRQRIKNKKTGTDGWNTSAQHNKLNLLGISRIDAHMCNNNLKITRFVEQGAAIAMY